MAGNNQIERWVRPKRFQCPLFDFARVPLRPPTKTRRRALNLPPRAGGVGLNASEEIRVDTSYQRNECSAPPESTLDRRSTMTGGIAVGNERSPSRQSHDGPVFENRHPRILERVPAPFDVVMIPSGEVHRYASVHEVGEFREHAVMLARNHGPVRHSELEEISVDEQTGRDLLCPPEKSSKGRLG